MSKKLIVVILLALGMVFQGASLWADDDAIMDVDDNAASFSGTWGRSTVRILYYGDDYQFASGSGGGETARATFTTAQTADITGNYHVYVRWTAGNMRATNANYLIYDNAGVYRGQCTKDQRYNGGAWQSCANISLTSGRRGVVRLGNAGVPTNRYVCADAVRFVRVSKDKYDIVDEPGVDFSSINGHYAISNSASSPTSLRSVTISCPGVGTQYVVATGSVYAKLRSGSTSASNVSQVLMSLSTSTSWDYSRVGMYGARQNVTTTNTVIGYGTISKSHVFTCVGGSSVTVRLLA